MLSIISSARDGTLCTIPLLIPEFGLTWTCTSLVHAVTTAESSHVHLPCCVFQTLFPSSHPCLWLLHLFQALFSSYPWAFGRGGAEYVNFREENAAVCYFRYLGNLWVPVLITIYYKQKFLQWGSRDALINGYNDESLGVCLNTMPI